MATAAPHPRPTSQARDSADATTGSRRRTEHLKQVPGPKALRHRIRERAIELAAGLDKSRSLPRHEMERLARRLLAGMNLPEAYVGWTMVALASAFWHDQVAAVPYHRRLLLLPRCLRNERVCLAECDETGLRCRDCGACSLSELRAQAERNGYRVMIAEGSPVVMKIILAGEADALLGVACLDVLEKTLDRILLAGIPCTAVPLLTSGCHNTSADEDWIRQMIATPHRPAPVRTHTYLHLMRCAASMFEPEELERLVPRIRRGAGNDLARGAPPAEPIAFTEALAYEFLSAGGKHSRPFITLAVYDAQRENGKTNAEGAQPEDLHGAARLPQAVRRVALAVETFHKASLVHDDIEDEEPCRYGRATLHRQYGTATAINVGDYLIGLGYRIVAAQRGALPADVVADILSQFARAHTTLCEGQGAELAWREAPEKRLPPLEALKIYALKTAPAFEAALLAGIRLAGPVEPHRQSVARFARHLGVAYQILDDLDDWEDARRNGYGNGTAPLAGRPTVLWALALEGLKENARRELESLLAKPSWDQAGGARADGLYQRAGAYRKAAALACKHHQRARAAADEFQNQPLRRLLHFIADAVLDRRPLALQEEK